MRSGTKPASNKDSNQNLVSVYLLLLDFFMDRLMTSRGNATSILKTAMGFYISY